MRLTSESDYALRIVRILALDPTARPDSTTLAETAGVPTRFAVKILHKLVGAGLICSYKGVHGGYMLAKDADKITLKDVIEVIDGPILLAKCVGDGASCAMNGDGSACVFHHIFEDISISVAKKLSSIRISDVIGEK